MLRCAASRVFLLSPRLLYHASNHGSVPHRMSLTRRYKKADGSVVIYHYDRVKGVPAREYHREVSARHRRRRRIDEGATGDDPIHAVQGAKVLCEEDKRRIRRLHGEARVSQRRLADIWGVAPKVIRDVVRE